MRLDESAQLPGIGPALAQRILDYRQAKGPDLLETLNPPIDFD